jgi:tetratricopeptide (TPR) repeat protein
LPVLEQLTFLDDDIGHVLAARGQPDAAVGLAQERLRLDQKLVAARPDNVEYKSDLGGAHNELGRLALQHGDLISAIAEYHADDAIETSLSTRNPKDNDQREITMNVRAILGRTLVLGGEVTTGMRDLQQAVEIAGQLTQVDATQTSFQEHLALYSTQLARLQRLSGDLPTARTSTARSVRSLRALVKKDPTNYIGQSYYTGALTEQAAESLAVNQPGAAHDQIQRALQILEPMLAKHPDDRETLLAATTARLLSAETDPEPQAAQSQRERVLGTLQTVKTSRTDPRLVALQVEALLALGRKAAAQPLIKQLWASGYRDPALLVVMHREHIDYPVNAAFEQRLAAIMKSTQADAALLPTTEEDIKQLATHR